MWTDDFSSEVEGWRARGWGRMLRAPASKSALDFTSNDYLGLSGHPQLARSAMRAVEAYGTSGRASRLLGGGSAETLGVEAKLADWLGAEAALLFPSGYQANMTLLPAIAGRGDVVVSDELNHASLIDAIRLSGATVRVYRHGDAAHAEALLGASKAARRRFLVTESVFSMDGDIAPLGELAHACQRTGSRIIADEAHAVGVVGPGGRGLCAEQGLAGEASPTCRVVTCGKAMGASGGALVGSRDLMDLLIHRGRGFVFSTAVAPAIVGAIDASIELVDAASGARRELQRHAAAVAAASRTCSASALGLAEPAAAIVPLVVGAAGSAVEAQERLAEQGLDVRAVRPPTVPDGTSRLRIVCRADHGDAEVATLVSAIESLRLRQAPSDPGAAGPGAIAVSGPRRPLIVVGTDTDIGKTVVSAVAVLATDGRYWKPVQTGDDSDTETVTRLTATSCAVGPPRYHFALPASPHTAAAAEGAVIDPSAVDDALRDAVREAGADRLIVELAGGLHVPLTDNFTQADWISSKAADVLLVARSSLGTLNHTLLTLEALRARRITPKALVLVGEPHAANAATLRAHVPALFELPVLSELSRGTLTEWLSSNQLAEFLR